MSAIAAIIAGTIAAVSAATTGGISHGSKKKQSEANDRLRSAENEYLDDVDNMNRQLSTRDRQLREKGIDAGTELFDKANQLENEKVDKQQQLNNDQMMNDTRDKMSRGSSGRANRAIDNTKRMGLM